MYLFDFFNTDIQKCLHIIIIIIVIYLFISYKTAYNTAEINNKIANKYSDLDKNIDSKYTYIYANYLIAYIFYLLLPIKKYNPGIFNYTVKKTNKLLKLSDICLNNTININIKNILDIIIQLKEDILNNLLSITINEHDINNKLISRMAYLLNMIFENIILKVKTKLNKQWNEEKINIHSSLENTDIVPSSNMINTKTYSPHFSLY
tara:strand:- start:132 stop:749 length:618 start_codon:yes stop_codon:yes gene_type:complete